MLLTRSILQPLWPLRRLITVLVHYKGNPLYGKTKNAVPIGNFPGVSFEGILKDQAELRAAAAQASELVAEIALDLEAQPVAVTPALTQDQFNAALEAYLMPQMLTPGLLQTVAQAPGSAPLMSLQEQMALAAADLMDVDTPVTADPGMVIGNGGVAAVMSATAVVRGDFDDFDDFDFDTVGENVWGAVDVHTATVLEAVPLQGTPAPPTLPMAGDHQGSVAFGGTIHNPMNDFSMVE